ncbi:hypothetical protein ACOSP7_028573 [Xanthoceras sorbifolium]
MKKRKIFRARARVTDRMFKHLNRTAEVVENKKSTKKDDTNCNIVEAIELLHSNSKILRKSELYILATKLFLKKQNGEMFVAFKDDPKFQIEWLKEMNKRILISLILY